MLNVERQTQSLLDLSRADSVRDTVVLSLDDPNASLQEATAQLLQGDLNGAIEVLDADGNVTLTREIIERSGFDVQPELKLSFADADAKISLILESGVNDITSRTTLDFDALGEQSADGVPQDLSEQFCRRTA